MDGLAAGLHARRDPTATSAQLQHSPDDFLKLLPDGTYLGEYCALARQNFVKELFVLLKNELVGKHEEALRTAPWIQQLFGGFLVIYLWDQTASRSVNEAVIALRRLLTSSTLMSSAVLETIQNAVNRLWQQFKVIEKLLPLSSVDEDAEFCELFDNAFQSLQETSVLPAILAFCAPSRINAEFVQGLPLIKSPSGADFATKRVRFSDSTVEDDDECVLLVPAERARDVMIIRSYGILCNIMAAVHQDAMARKMSVSSKRSSRLSLQRELSLNEADMTSGYLTEVDKNLREILPLNYRLEIMENVFCLLFLRSDELEESYVPAELLAETSEAESLKSWTSAGKVVGDGFSCCSDALVRRILGILREVAIFTSSHSKNDADSIVDVHCSVRETDVNGRLGLLQHKITDALWRLDIVTFPLDLGLSLNPAYADDLVRPSFLTRELDTKSSRRKRRRRKTSKVLKRQIDSSAVQKMLATPDSLLRICLHRGTCELADQVIKIFSLGDQNWNKELSFGQNYLAHQRSLFNKPTMTITPNRKKSQAVMPKKFEDVPLAPSSGLDEEQTKVLVGVDTAILSIAAHFSACARTVKFALECLAALLVKFPAVKRHGLPDMQPFDAFVRDYLDNAVDLSRQLPFTKALPFKPVSLQSLAAFQDEILRRTKRMQAIFLETGKGGSTGYNTLKQLNKILRTSLPVGGFLGMINGQQVDTQATRTNYLFSTIVFLKNYATSLKLEPDADNFDLLHKSPYRYFIKLLSGGSGGQDVDVFVKCMALDISRCLFKGIFPNRAVPLVPHDEMLNYSNSPITLNAVDLNDTVYGTVDLLGLVATCLANVLKVFSDTNDSIYQPRKVTWTMIAHFFRPLAALQQFDLSLLRTRDEERLAFFVNVYNLMFVQANFCSRLQSAQESVRDWSGNAIAHRLHFWRYRYQIGTLGTVSLQELYDGLSPMRTVVPNGSFQPPRRKESGFLLANMDYRMTIRVLYPEMLRAQTSLAVAEYLDDTAKYDSVKKILRLPTWLFQVGHCCTPHANSVDEHLKPFQIYPSDQLHNLLRMHWKGSSTVEIDLDSVILEPSKLVDPAAKFRHGTATWDSRIRDVRSVAKSSRDAESVDKFNYRKSDSSGPEIPLDDVLPFLASPCSYLFSLLSPGGGNNRLLPTNSAPRVVLQLLAEAHCCIPSLDFLCKCFYQAMRSGEDPLLLTKVPLIHFTLTASPVGGLLLDIVKSLAVEKTLTSEPWILVAGIADIDLRLRCIQQLWMKWPLVYCVELLDLVDVEDSRSTIKRIHARTKSLLQLMQALNTNAELWTTVFPNWKFVSVATEMAVRDVEKRLESQFTTFTAVMLRLDQIQPLNSWLQHSDLASLAMFEDELQLRGLVHMLDSRPPMILSAYQILIPMIKTCDFARITQLLEAINSPEGRLPVIRIALLSGRFDEVDCIRLQEKEVENQILCALPEFFRKSIAHLQGHPLLILEQLILWGKLEYLTDILKVPNLFEVFSKRMFEGVLVEYARKAVEVTATKSSHSGSVVMDERRPRRNTPDSDAGSFIIPPTTPSRNDWTNETSISNCMICADKFSIFNRKHHCRRCGRVVCGSCSSQTIQIDAYGDNPVRACDDCFDQTIALGSSLRSSRSSGITFSASKLKSPPSSSPVRQPHSRILRQSASVSENTDQQRWLFTTDETSNQRLRNEFFYANAPDAVFCVGLFKLHSNSSIAGKELLKVGNELSEWIGTHDDCGLENATILGTMKTLFFNAKLFLHGDADKEDWIGVCDTYLNQLQLIELLLDAGATEIPSVKQLAELDTIRRVRDQLVQQERYALAIEISTKAGLDPANVWLSWGRCLLKVGKFVEAEDKLSKCLRLPMDKHQTFPPSASALEDVMDIIMEARMPRRRGTISADSVLQIVLHGDILKPETVDPALIEQENTRKMTECLHYQETYGTHLSLIKFYMKRGLIQTALEYTLRENVTIETFMEAIVNPCLRAGQLRSLEDELLMSDQSLVKWTDYLTGICKILTKRNTTHLLLSFQLFMRDHLRAATTCVMFFQAGSSSTAYQAYFDNLHYLEEAQKHILSYLEMVHSADSSVKFRLRLPEDEVRKYAKTIQLQVLITKLLSSRSNLEDRRPSASLSSFPTLFGNAQAKLDLIGLLLQQHSSPTAEEYVLAVIDLYALVVEDVFGAVASSAGKDGLKGTFGALMTLRKRGTMSDSQYDGVVVKMIGATSSSSLTGAAKEWEVLIRQMSADDKKVEAFAKAGRLKSAYLMAVNMKRVDLVEYTANEAVRLGDTAVQSICKRWLDTHRKG